MIVLSDGKKLAGLIEVESSESVNNLEAMAQWVHFSRAKVPFHLYVPVHVYDAARRLCEANQARVTEIWTYRAAADGFDLVRIHADASVSAVATRHTAEAKPASNIGKTPATPSVKTSKPKPKPKAKAEPAKRPALPKSRKKPAARPARASKPAARSKRR